MSPVSHTLWRWTRLASAKWEDSWAERLQFLGPGNVAIVGWPGSRSIRIEAFCDERTARKLVREFGGRATKARDWTADPERPRKPLSIRGRLMVHGSAESYAEAPPRKGSAAILIPAGMAFGTGDHATTASCLRMLCDISKELPAGWTAVDAGTGSGILAIAASALGAGDIEAFDYDPACVRIARANARANRSRSVRVHQADVLHWESASRRDVVMANLYSELLVKAAPRLCRALRRRGWFIFSGVLRSQLAEVRDALDGRGFHILRIVERGKWAAGLCRLQ